MTLASNLGFPRIGQRRELKVALEKFWAGDIAGAELEATAAALCARHWRLQAQSGISHVPSGDFSLYDHVLDTACMLGAIPPGYGWSDGPVSLATYFALARGTGSAADPGAGLAAGLPAMEMTKWFDTNYHYMVPRLSAGQRFTLTSNRLLNQFRQAMALNIRTRPVLLGPVSFLLLSKTTDGSDPLDLLQNLLPVYAQILSELAEAGAAWVQMDEPVLALDLSAKAKQAFEIAYGTFAAAPAPEILLVSYFGPFCDNLVTAASLPVAGLHIDLARGAAELDMLLEAVPADRWLSLGVVDGRNVWRTDLQAALAILLHVSSVRGARRLMVAPSCSLLHVPVDLAQEGGLDPEVKSWLAFATQKLEEIQLLTAGLEEGQAAITVQLAASDAVIRARKASTRVHRADVADRLANVTEAMQQRVSAYPQRRMAQQAKLHLPLFPTTTIGSFPQTTEVRQARAALTRNETTRAQYETTIEGWINDAVQWQENLGLDVLVHGEFERNDMVKYFGEQLSGYAFTQHGWVAILWQPLRGTSDYLG